LVFVCFPGNVLQAKQPTTNNKAEPTAMQLWLALRNGYIRLWARGHANWFAERVGGKKKGRQSGAGKPENRKSEVCWGGRAISSIILF